MSILRDLDHPGAAWDLWVALKESDLPAPRVAQATDPGYARRRLAPPGIPHVAGISAPKYLVRVSENGDIENDASLASRQTGFYADVVKSLDSADPAALKAGGEGDSASTACPIASIR